MTYEKLTKFAETFGTRTDLGSWTERTGSGTPGDPNISSSFLVEGQLYDFLVEFEHESDSVADYEYPDTLKAYGLSSHPQDLTAADIEHADLRLTRAILTTCIRKEYYVNGSIIDRDGAEASKLS